VLDNVDIDRATRSASETTVARLVAISTLAVRCRSAVERDGYTREVQLIPEPEAPARLALVLLRLLNALAAAGVPYSEAWRLVAKCALDSMPAIRRAVLEDLMEHRLGTTTPEGAVRLAYPTNTVRRGLEDLAAHGIVQRESGGAGRPDMWLPTAWAIERWDLTRNVGTPMATVPEMSEDMHTKHENGAETPSISPPLRIGGDISGTPPAPLWDEELAERATDDDGEMPA
jgi:hypothetical protein